MSRAGLNFLIDLAMFLVSLAMLVTGLLMRFVLPPGSGERRGVWELTRHQWGDVHFWLAVGLAGLVLLHLVLHWRWVCAYVSGWFREARESALPRSAVRRNLVGLALGVGTLALVGGIIWAAQLAVVEDGGRGFRGGRDALSDDALRGDRESRPTQGRGREVGEEDRGRGRRFGNPRPTEPQPDQPEPKEDPPVPAETAAATQAAAQTRVIAYYFHRSMRCPTCLSIEQQSREAIELTYNGELSAGTLEWHAVNIEEPGNEHFEKDFDLQSQSLVLVEMTGKQVARWKLLPRVWELVENPYGFQEYVVTEVAAFLGGG